MNIGTIIIAGVCACTSMGKLQAQQEKTSSPSELLEFLNSKMAKDLDKKLLKSSIQDSIKVKSFEKSIELIAKSNPIKGSADVEDLKKIYVGARTEIWKMSDGQNFWKNFITLCEFSDDDFFVEQISNDILLFDYRKEVDEFNAFASPNLYSRESKLKYILPYVLRQKTRKEYLELCERVINSKRIDIARALGCYFPIPENEVEKHEVATKVIELYNNLKAMKDHGVKLEQFLSYSQKGYFSLYDYILDIRKAAATDNLKNKNAIENLKLLNDLYENTSIQLIEK